jgi:hypothetical protein
MWWHREGFRLFWRRESRSTGPRDPPLGDGHRVDVRKRGRPAAHHAARGARAFETTKIYLRVAENLTKAFGSVFPILPTSFSEWPRIAPGRLSFR